MQRELQMSREEIEDTKEAIEVLRQALKRQSEQYKNGVYVAAAIPIWNAAGHLTRSMPREER